MNDWDDVFLVLMWIPCLIFHLYLFVVLLGGVLAILDVLWALVSLPFA